MTCIVWDFGFKVHMIVAVSESDLWFSSGFHMVSYLKKIKNTSKNISTFVQLQCSCEF